MHLKQHASFSLFRTLALALALILSISLSGCGKGSKDDSEASPQSITITSGGNSLVIGSEVILTATLIYSDTSRDPITDKAIWKSDDVLIATVTPNAVATCISAGTVTIIATYEDFSDELKIVCNPEPYITSITLTPNKTEIFENDDPIQLVAEITMNIEKAVPPKDISLQWKSSNESIVSVDDKGEVTALSHGVATIEATIETSEGSITGTAEITVTPTTKDVSLVGIGKYETDPITNNLLYYLDLGEEAKLSVIAHKTNDTTTSITGDIAFRKKWDFKGEGKVLIDYTGLITAEETGEIKAIVLDYDGHPSNNAAIIRIEKPLELIVTKDTDNQIELSWRTKFGINNYKLYKKRLTDESFDAPIDVTGNSYTDYEISMDTTYEYQLSYVKPAEDEKNGEKLSPKIEVTPHQNKWIKQSTFPAYSNTSSIVVDNSIFVFGGEKTNPDGMAITTNEIWEYNITTDLWSKLPQVLPSPRQSSAICEVDGYVFLLGGFDSTIPPESTEPTNGTILNDIIVFHPYSGLWVTPTTNNTLPKALTGASCSATADGTTLYLTGGTNETAISADVLAFTIDTLNSITITPTPSAATLANARYQHQSTILDGLLYVAGGKILGADGIESTTNILEIFDLSVTPIIPQPVNTLPHMNTARHNFSLKLIDDGENRRIYAYGGQDNENKIVKSVEYFDPALAVKLWVDETNIPFDYVPYITEYIPVGNKIYLFGGKNQTPGETGTNSVLSVNTTLSWHVALDSARNIYNSSAGVIGDNVYFFGGRDANGKASDETQIFNITDNAWVTASRGPDKLKVPRVNSASVSTNNLIYTMGGLDTDNKYLASLEIYSRLDPPNIWEQQPATANMITPRENACAAVHGDYIYVFGGQSSSSEFAQTIERYNTKKTYKASETRWKNVSTWSKPRAGMSCVTVQDTIYLIGGYDDSKTQLALSKVEVFLPNSPTSTPKVAYMLNERIKPATSAFNGRIYLFGGISGTFKNAEGLASSLVYTPEAGPGIGNNWREDLIPENLETPSNNPFSVVYGSKIYVFGHNHTAMQLESISSLVRTNETTIYVLE